MANEPEQIIFGDTAISAVEQPPGKRRFFRRKGRQRPPLSHCENCGTQLQGRWCAQCGQPAIDYRRSFRHVMVDVLDSFLNWDSKFFATIGWLIVRPWRLTNEFLAGHRVRYLHPLRLYLLASILFFFVINYWAKSFHVDPSKISPQDRAEVEADLEKENISPEIRQKVRDAMSAKSSPEPTAGAAQTPSPTATPEVNPIIQFDKGDGPKTPFENWIETRAKEKMGEHGTKMGLFIKTLISNLPYMVLCCIPLFAFVLKVLYLRRRVLYIDHLVYALHIHTFAYVGIMLIGLITIGLNRTVPHTLAGWIVGLLWLAFVVQIFLSIRRVYRQGWFFSIFKFFVGGLAYLIVLSVALAATFIITVILP
jgi:hypothetical protein